MQMTFTASPRGTLVVLLWLRVLAVAGQGAAVAVAWYGLHVQLPLAAMGIVVAAMAVLVLLTALRLRAPWPCTHLELAMQLLLDVFGLTLILYFSGGTTNPFASLYLVPIAIAAVALDWRYTAGILSACLVSYLVLTREFVPLSYRDEDAAGIFNLHIFGMGVNFVVSAVLLGVFLAMLTREVRRRDRELAQLREDALRREHLTSMGLLAAGAAHELGTPLSTIAVLVSELKSDPRTSPASKENLDLLGRQVIMCKEKLGNLLRFSGHERAPETRLVRLRELLQDAIDAVRTLHPRVRFELRAPDTAPDAVIRADAGLVQTLHNLLNNAAEASGRGEANAVLVEIQRDTQGLLIAMDDDGPGLSDDVRRLAGKAVFSTKPGGAGLGLILSNANLSRLGGEVSLSRRAEGGTRTSIRLPLVLVEPNRHG